LGQTKFEGKIGLEAFRLLVNGESFANVMTIMETPESETMHQVNLKVLRGVVNLSPLWFFAQKLYLKLSRMRDGIS